MTSRIGSSPVAVRPPPSAHVQTPATPAPAAEVDPNYRTVAVTVNGLVGRMEAKRPALATTAKQLHDALTDQTFGIWQQRGDRMSREQAMGQHVDTLRSIVSAVETGKAGGDLIAGLKAMAKDPDWSPKVRSAAARVADVLAPEIQKVAIAADFKNGPVSLPFEVKLDGGSFPATLQATARDGRLSDVKAQVGGKSYQLTDDAVSELLGRAGRHWDPENSSQTEVMGSRFLGLGGAPDAITFDGGAFREVTKSDLRGSPVYFHKGDIALVGE